MILALGGSIARCPVDVRLMHPCFRRLNNFKLWFWDEFWTSLIFDPIPIMVPHRKRPTFQCFQKLEFTKSTKLYLTTKRIKW